VAVAAAAVEAVAVEAAAVEVAVASQAVAVEAAAVEAAAVEAAVAARTPLSPLRGGPCQERLAIYLPLNPNQTLVRGRWP